MAKKHKRPPKPIGGLTLAERKTLRALLDKLDGAEPKPKGVARKALPKSVRGGTIIEVPRLKGGEGRTKNTKRGFWIDGTHAYLRAKKATPAMKERVAQKVKTGEYRHVKTTDDVQIFEIADDSPLRRKPLDISQLSASQIELAIVKSACARDWRLYYDAVSELGFRLKNELPAGTAHKVLQDLMKYLHLRIARRGGPNDFEIARELAGIRKQRSGRQIFLAPDQNIDRQ